MSEKPKQMEALPGNGDKTPLSQEKLPEQNTDLKFRMELELFKGGINDEIFLNNYLKNFYGLNLNSLSPEVKVRFIEEIKIMFEELKGFNVGMVKDLREIRESMSMGIENGKDDNYYRSMMIGNKLQNRITILQEFLKTTRAETFEFKGNNITKESYSELENGMNNLDKNNGLKVFENLFNNRYSRSYGLEEKKMNFGGINIKQIVIDEFKKANKPFDKEISEQYEKIYFDFGLNKKIYDQGNKILNQNKNRKQKGFGFGFNSLGYKDLENKYSEKLLDVDKMGMADLVILMRVLFGVIPVTGDIVGGLDDGKQARSGINFDGSIQGIPENISMYCMAGLQLSVVGGRFATIAKGPKYAKIMFKLGKTIDRLSKIGDIQKLAKNEKVIQMFEVMKGFIPKAGELLERIKIGSKVGREKVTLKVNEKFPKTISVLKGNKKIGIPKITPEEILKAEKIHSKIDIYFKETCQELKIKIDPNDYANIYQDILLISKLEESTMRYNINKYMMIYIINPNISLSKIITLNNISPILFLTEYLIWLRDPKFGEIISKINVKTFYFLIQNYSLNNFEKYQPKDFEKLISLYEKYGDGIYNIIVFSMSFDGLIGHKLELAEIAIKKRLNSNLLEKLYQTYVDVDYDLLEKSGFFDLNKVIFDETKSKEETERVINNFYALFEKIDIEPRQISSRDPWRNIYTDMKNPLFERFSDLLNFPEKFNSKTGLEFIKKLPSQEKQKAMQIWREKLKIQLDIIATFPTEVKKSAEKFDYINGKPEEVISILINEFSPNLKELSIEQRQQVIAGIEKYVNKKFMVHKYANDPKYINNPKQLIADSCNTDISKLKGDVTMEINGANFTFYVHDVDDYKLLESYGNEELAKIASSSGGFASPHSNIPELAGTISVANGKKEGRAYAIEAQLHETKHIDNQIIMPDHLNPDNLSRAKDEIIAYLTDGRSIEEIRYTLFRTGDTALYDYYEGYKPHPEQIKLYINQNLPDLTHVKSKEYNDLRKLYEEELNSAINIAHKIKEANIPNYIDILAITPVREWGRLEKIYLQPNNLNEVEKIQQVLKMIFEKTSETYYALRADTKNIGGYKLEGIVFEAVPALSIGGIGIISMNLFMEYIGEKYLDWRKDYKDNKKVFFQKTQELVKKENIEKFLSQKENIK